MKKNFNIINYFNTRALFMGIGLSRIISMSHEYVWLSLIIGTCIGLLLLYLLRIEMRKNIINVLTSSIIIVIALIILINMISTMYLTKLPKFLIGLPFIIIVMYLINKREIVTFRVSNIILVFNLFLYFIASLALMKYFKLENFYFTNVKFINILGAGVEYALYSITPTLLLRKKEHKDIPIYKTYIFSSLTMSIFFILTYGILGANLSGALRYPEYLILKQVSLSSAIENIENIISFVWIFDIFFLIVSCSNSIKYNLNNKKLTNIILFILLIITSIINSRYEIILIVYKLAPFIMGFVLILLWLINKKLILNKR